jgi:hypothetical protein
VGERPEGEYIELLISEESDRTELGAYGELLHDAIQGNCAGLLAKAMSKTWRIVNPVLTAADPLYSYEPGSWGPAEADRLVDAIGGWNNPQRIDSRINQPLCFSPRSRAYFARMRTAHERIYRTAIAVCIESSFPIEISLPNGVCSL